jgi:hypothetical protein
LKQKFVFDAMYLHETKCIDKQIFTQQLNEGNDQHSAATFVAPSDLDSLTLSCYICSLTLIATQLAASRGWSVRLLGRLLGRLLVVVLGPGGNGGRSRVGNELDVIVVTVVGGGGGGASGKRGHDGEGVSSTPMLRIYELLQLRVDAPNDLVAASRASHLVNLSLLHQSFNDQSHLIEFVWLKNALA